MAQTSQVFPPSSSNQGCSRGRDLRDQDRDKAGSRDPVDKAGTSETKTETCAAGTKTETEAIKITSLVAILQQVIILLEPYCSNLKYFKHLGKMNLWHSGFLLQYCIKIHF